MTIRWEWTARDPRVVTYFVDERPVGEGDRGFDRVLDLVEDGDGPVTIGLTGVSLGGAGLRDALPFVDRFDELQARVGDRQLVYALV